MKKIKQKYQPEIADRFCDICKKPAVSFLRWEFGYGSSRDLDYTNLDFCEKCGESILKVLKKKVPKLTIIRNDSIF